MTRTARNICTCAVFATTSFNFGLPTYFVSYYGYGRALYGVFCRRVAFLQELAPYTSICSSIFVFVRSMFAFIPPFVDFVRYPECSLSDILARHDSNTVPRGSRKKSVDYFMCSICRYGID